MSNTRVSSLALLSGGRTAVLRSKREKIECEKTFICQLMHVFCQSRGPGEPTQLRNGSAAPRETRPSHQSPFCDVWRWPTPAQSPTTCPTAMRHGLGNLAHVDSSGPVWTGPSPPSLLVGLRRGPAHFSMVTCVCRCWTLGNGYKKPGGKEGDVLDRMKFLCTS